MPLLRCFFPFFRVCILGLALLGLPGCNLLSKSPASSNGANVTPSLKTLATQALSPSTNEQTAAYQDQVRIILPGGIVTGSQNLVISSVTGLPNPSPFRQVLGMYDFSLGDQHTFDQDLHIELAYDPQKLDQSKPAAGQLTAGYWDETAHAWLPVDSTMDEARHVIVITTDHLSIYGYLSWITGYSNYDSEHFSIVYDDKAIKNGSANMYKSVSTSKRLGMPDFISDSLDFLETAYKAYNAEDYPLPPTKINVEVGNTPYSELGTLSGIIRLTTLDWHDANLLRHDSAHELFHAVQREALGTKNYLLRKWWMEATADYAADMVAWKGSIDVMGQDIGSKYLESSLNSTADFHDYSTSHFIAYLVSHQSIFAFSDLWWQTAGGGNNVLNTLKEKIKNPESFGQQYADFARFFVFDPASPDKKTRTISKDIAYQSNEMKQTDTELEGSFDVGYFSAKLWAVQISFERDVLIERKDAGYGSVSYAVLDGDTRTSPVSVPPTDMPTGNSISLHVTAGEYLYLLVDNDISTSTQTVQLKISEATTPSGMFTMTVKYDEGCDAAYKDSYNSWSRVNTNIPVKIDGTKVTIDYDKTTGVKHLVAQGSGTIDKTGTMTLNFTLTYTLEQSCDGQACTGTETATGTFTGTVVSGGAWDGKATGSVDVDYPNTLGKIGNNATSCTASPIKIHLRPGFTDTDL